MFNTLKKINISAIILSDIKKYLTVALISISVIIFFSFRHYERIEKQKVANNIATILKNELSVSNSYALAKTLSDLEGIGIFKCARLTEVSETNRVFYDTVLGKRCEENIFAYFFRQSHFLKGLNGVSYKLDFSVNANVFAYFFEFSLYLILLCLGYVLPELFIEIIDNEKIKIIALEVENQNMLSFAKQVSHDVASPLSAIRLMTSLLNNIDPEVKDLMNKAINRTQEIFDDLKFSKRHQSTISVIPSLLDIVKEKQMLWQKACSIKMELNPHLILFAIGVETEFKRAISNILNNSYEAMEYSNTKTVEINVVHGIEGDIKILIADSGKGMSQEVLARVGVKGFSYSKENLNDAGSGLGVSHAIATFVSWGGNLTYESQIDIGTKATVILKRV